MARSQNQSQQDLILGVLASQGRPVDRHKLAQALTRWEAGDITAFQACLQDLGPLDKASLQQLQAALQSRGELAEGDQERRAFDEVSALFDATFRALESVSGLDTLPTPHGPCEPGEAATSQEPCLIQPWETRPTRCRSKRHARMCPRRPSPPRQRPGRRLLPAGRGGQVGRDPDNSPILQRGRNRLCACTGQRFRYTARFGAVGPRGLRQRRRGIA